MNNVKKQYLDYSQSLCRGCISYTNASDKLDIITFCDGLSSLAQHIPRHNVLIIGGDMNAQIGKHENNKFNLNNLPNRNSEDLADVSLENSLRCLNIKFQKREENYGPTPTQIILKHCYIIYS